MILGAQMYTVREFTKTPEGISESLKKIADIGYTEVQVSGTCEFDYAWLKSELDKTGLKCVLTHSPANRIQNDTQKLIEDHSIIDCNNMGLGFYDFKENSFEDYCEKYSSASKQIAKSGKHFMHHNHNSEFIKRDGKTMMELLSEKFSKEELGFILDTFWVQFAGADSADWLKKLTGRVPCIHLKDMDYNRDMEVVGLGNINFERVISAAEEAGTQHLLVELDWYGERDPFDCLKQSYDYLKALGLR